MLFIVQPPGKVTDISYNYDDCYSISLQILLTNIDEVLKQLEAQAQMAENHFSTFTNLKKKLFGALANLGVSSLL